MPSINWSTALRGRNLVVPVIVGVCCAALGAGGAYLSLKYLPAKLPGEGSQAAAPEESGAETAAGPETITLPKPSWEYAGLRIESVVREPFTESVQVTGKIDLNGDRVAHVFPLVSGRVVKVNVRYGQQVKFQEELAIVQSIDVGQAKLELFQARLQRDIAKHRVEVHEEILKNTRELIAALEKETPVEEIERQFRNKPMGDYRAQLVSSYTNFHKSQADLERMQELAERNIAAGKQLVAAQAARDAGQATLQAWLEQIKFDSYHENVLRQQAYQEAETKVSVAESHLRILGYDQADLTKIDPAAEGESLSYYPVKAPFDGTIISKDIVLLERISPSQQLFQIADLSTVWVTADIYEQQLPLLRNLEQKTVTLHSDAYPGREFEARVFYTGEIVDSATRTVRLTAMAENPERLLKPGMFVEVDLPGQTDMGVLQVPDTAVEDHEGKQFVFVHRGGEQFERRDVVLGRRAHGMVEIEKGLKEGESVVIAGAFAVKSRMLDEMLSE